MSKNHYTSYYLNQAGSGIGGFQGHKFQWDDQTGEGFLDIIKAVGMPILKYLGKKAISTGLNVANEAFSGDNVLQSTKRNLKRTAQDIAGDVGERALRFAQTGKGKKRRRMRKKKLVLKTKKRHVLKAKKFKTLKNRKAVPKRKRKRRVKTLFD